MVGEYPLRVKIHKYLGRNSNRRTSVSGQEARCLGKWLLSLDKSEKEHSTLTEAGTALLWTSVTGGLIWALNNFFLHFSKSDQLFVFTVHCQVIWNPSPGKGHSTNNSHWTVINKQTPTQRKTIKLLFW